MGGGTTSALGTDHDVIGKTIAPGDGILDAEATLVFDGDLTTVQASQPGGHTDNATQINAGLLCHVLHC